MSVPPPPQLRMMHAASPVVVYGDQQVRPSTAALPLAASRVPASAFNIPPPPVPAPRQFPC